MPSWGEQVPGTLWMGNCQLLGEPWAAGAPAQPKLCPQNRCPHSGLALGAAWQGGAALGVCDMPRAMGGHQAGCSTLRVPRLSHRVPRPWSGRGPLCHQCVTSVPPVCHQCVTMPDHCQVPGCTWDLTQPWGLWWAQGADSSPGAQGGTCCRSSCS